MKFQNTQILLVLPLLLISQNASAEVAASPATIEAGVIKPDTSTVQKVELTNTSTTSVRLLSAEVSCTACTKVQFTPTTLNPDKKMQVEITFKPPVGEEGMVRRTVTFHTSDPKQKEVVVTLSAYVTTSAGIWPQTIAPAAPQKPGADVESTFEIINVSDKPLTPLYATGPLDGPKLTVPHTPVPAGGRATIKAKWHMPAKAGPITGQLILFVDHPTISKLSVPYQAVVLALPATQPATMATTAPHAGGDHAASRSASPTTMPALPAATQAAATSPSPPVPMVNLDLKESLPLKDFVDIVASQLKLNLIYDDAALTAPVTIRLNNAVPADALLPLLKTILQTKGLAMVPTDRPDFWRIVTSHEAQTLAEPGRPTGAAPAGAAQIVTEFITPQSVDLETAAGLLRGFMTPGVGQITSVPRIKSLIVTDYASQLARLHRLMDLIDKPQTPASLEIIPLKFAEAGPLADRITKLLVQINKTEGRTESEKVFLSPSDDAGGIVLVGPEDDLPRVTALIKRFDTAPALVRVDYPVNDPQRAQAMDTIRQVLGQTANAAGPDGSPRIVTAPLRLSVLATEGQHRRIKDLLSGVTDLAGEGTGIQLKAYRIQNRDAAEIYATLTRLLGDTRGGAINLEPSKPKLPSGVTNEGITHEGITHVGSMPGDPTAKPAEPVATVAPALPRSYGPGSVNITVDQGTNTLLIAASGETHQKIERLITELDQKQAQVLLEVMLVDVSDSDSFTAAVDAAVKATVAGSTIGIGTNAGISGGDFVTGRTPTVQPGFNAAIFNPSSFSLFMQALQSNSKARVLSSPQVLALDNKPAMLQSTQEQPYTSLNASTTVATTSFAGFAEAGTTLELTPHIAPADYVNLEYRLEVSSFTGASASAGVPPPKQTSAITSFVSVPDGSTVVLGGLRSSNDSKTTSKVPGLGDIPILGWIGKNENDTTAHDAFYVFVRPVILRAAKFEDLKGISADQRRQAGIGGDFPETKPRFIQ